MRLFWIGLIWLAGIAIGRFAGLAASSYLLAGLLGLLLAIVGEESLRTIGVAAAVFFLGAWRVALAIPDFEPAHISAHNDTFRIARLTGVISDFPDVRDDYIGLRVDAESVRYSEEDDPFAVSGGVLVRADRFSSFAYGDRIEVLGVLETPPEFQDFSYREFLARQGIFSLISNASVAVLEQRQGNPIVHVLFDLRQRGLETLHLIFPDPEASLLAGILLGVESGISSEVREAFNDTSTTHIIAISGFNITILAAIVIALTGRMLGMRRGAIAAGLVIALYTVLVGADAAVVRAAIMGGLVLFARYLGRTALALASLAAAAIVMTIVNPLVLWDVGFQLSFAATLGLVLYAEPIKDWFVRIAGRWLEQAQARRLSVPVGEFVLFTFAAQVTTLPLTVYYFQRLSLVAFLTNPVVLPAQPPLMMLGGLAMVAGMIWLPLGQVVAWIAWPFPAFTIRAIDWFAEFPSAAIDLGEISLPTMAAMYAVLFGVTIWSRIPRERRWSLPRPSRIALSIGVIVIALLAIKAAGDRPDGYVHVTALESGGTLIESAGGRFVLIGGGESSSSLANTLGRKLPLFSRRIDWLIVPDGEVAGLAGIPAGLQISGLMHATETPGRALSSVIGSLQARGTRVIQPEPGMALDLGNDSRLMIAGSEDGELTLLLTVGRARIGIMPNSRSVDSHLLDPLSGILLPNRSLTQEVLDLDVDFAVITGEVPVSMERSGPELLATDELGWIELITDGEQLWIVSQRNGSR